MRMHAKRTLSEVAVAIPVLFLTIWGVGSLANGINDSMAITTCDSSATGIDDAICLQDMNDSVKASMDEGIQYALVDSRDGKTYQISKLDDGNVWMTQNLHLGSTSSTIALSPVDTDISIGSTFTTLPQAQSLVESDYYTVSSDFIAGGEKYLIFAGEGAPRDIVRDNGSSHYRLGSGYPWTIATAQTANYVDPSDQTDISMTPSDSICPAGWKLPSQDEYRDLLAEYDLLAEEPNVSGTAAISAALRGTPFFFIRGFPYLLGTEGHYWTSTTVEDVDHYVANVLSIGTNEAGVNHDTDELSGVTGMVRCMARTDSDFTYTLSYNLNGASGSIDSTEIESSRKQVTTTVTTTEPTWNHHNFLGWADSSSATAASYSKGASITLGGNKTLYAVWEVVVSDQTVSFEQSSVNKTFGDAEFTNVATTTGDGAITYSSNNTSVAEIDSDTGKVTINGAGTATITASAAATDYYYSASATYSLTVSKVTPTISFTNTEITKTFGDVGFTNAASATSGGVISYQSNNTAVATVNSATGEVTIVGAGTATITATVAATDNYNSNSATYSLTVSSATATISFTNTAVAKTYGDAKFTNVATTISDGTISYSSNNTAVATVNSATGEVVVVGAGTATITASVPATTNYNSASATYALTVNKKTSATPEEVSEIKTGYVTDALSTVVLNTPGLTWTDGLTRIKEGYNGYAVSYTENADTNNYTTESFEITVLGKRRSYAVIDGEGAVYKLGSGQELISFKVDANHGLFGEDGAVYVDGALLDSQYYSVRADGDAMVVDILGDYLETLSVGNYELGIYFSNGGLAETTFEVEKMAEKDDEEEIMPVPNTGALNNSDDRIGVNTMICVLPGGIMAVVMVSKYIYSVRKSHRKFKW